MIPTTVFGIELWIAIADPTGRKVFLCMLLIGALLLLIARLMNRSRH